MSTPNFILELALQRALQLAQFANFTVTLRSGEVSVSNVSGEQVEDSLAGYTVPAVVAPVTVRYRDIEIDPSDLLAAIPEVDGEMVITSTRPPCVNFDAAKLGAMRKEWDARA